MEVGCERAGNREAQRWRVDLAGEGQRVAVRSVGGGGWLGLLAGGDGRVGVVEGRVEWEVGWDEGVPGAARLVLTTIFF